MTEWFDGPRTESKDGQTVLILLGGGWKVGSGLNRKDRQAQIKASAIGLLFHFPPSDSLLRSASMVHHSCGNIEGELVVF